MILGSEAGSLPRGPANARIFSSEKTSLPLLVFSQASRSTNDAGFECSTTLIRSFASSKTLIKVFYDVAWFLTGATALGLTERIAIVSDPVPPTFPETHQRVVVHPEVQGRRLL